MGYQMGQHNNYLYKSHIFILTKSSILFFLIVGSSLSTSIFTSDSDQPLITIPRPVGQRKPPSGKYQSIDGTTKLQIILHIQYKNKLINRQ